MNQQEQLAQALKQFQHRYVNNPALFVEEVLQVKPDPWQAQVLKWVTEGERRISIRSGHGVGKSSCASWLMIWHQLTRFPQKTVVTAPSHSQLHDALGAEVRRWITALPDVIRDQLEVLSEQIRLIAAPSESFISFRVSRPEKGSAETLQGVHSDHVLLVVDEASGINNAIFEASAGSMSGDNAVTLLLGNPVRGQGFFYDTHNKLASEDSSRVSKDFVKEIENRYGRESNQFRVRVSGEFPMADEDAIIPRHLVEGAVARDVEGIGGDVIMGVDVARFGSDASAICVRQGNKIIGDRIKTKRGLDTMQVVGWVRKEMEELREQKYEIGEVCVDSIGLGAGVVDRLLEEGVDVRGVNVGESPSMGGNYLNLRTELWEKCRLWFEGKDVVIPNDEQLINELCSVSYGYSSTGKTKVESKDDIRRRLGNNASPDAADALILTFASYASRNASKSWSKPLNREIMGIV
jgi:phage terminase large subunit